MEKLISVKAGVEMMRNEYMKDFVEIIKDSKQTFDNYVQSGRTDYRLSDITNLALLFEKWERVKKFEEMLKKIEELEAKAKMNKIQEAIGSEFEHVAISEQEKKDFW